MLFLTSLPWRSNSSIHVIFYELSYKDFLRSFCSIEIVRIDLPLARSDERDLVWMQLLDHLLGFGALLARAFAEQDIFLVFGDGSFPSIHAVHRDDICAGDAVRFQKLARDFLR